MAELPRALGSIVNSLRGVDRSTSSFKQAANDNQRSMSKIVKDLTTMTAGQRKELSNLNNSMDDIAAANQQNAARISTTNSLLEQSLTIQQSMVKELRDLKKLLSVRSEKSSQTLESATPTSAAASTMKNIALGGLKLGAAGVGLAGVVSNLDSILDAETTNFSGSSNSSGARARNLMFGSNASEYRPAGGNGSTSEAMQFFQSKGWTKEQAAGIVGNLQAESGKNLKINSVGDGGRAYGIAQWHPDRQAYFRRVFGKDIRESNFKEQLEFIQRELETTEQEAAQKLKQANSVESATRAFAEYERYKGWDDPNPNATTIQRIANAAALAGSSQQSQQSITQGVQGTATQQSNQPQAQTGSQLNLASQPQQQQSAQSTQGSEGSQPAAFATFGSQSSQQGRGVIDPQSEALPPGDIVALGKYLQSMRLRVSEHPAFGGVGGMHVRNSAHYRGQAIDVNVGKGIKEADHPVYGKKFDELEKQLTAAGYKVIWRKPGHFGHMHVQMGNGQAQNEYSQNTQGSSRGYSVQQQPQVMGMGTGGGIEQILGALGANMGSPMRTFGPGVGMQQANPLSAILGNLSMMGGPFGQGAGIAGGLFGILQNILPPMINAFQQPEQQPARQQQAANQAQRSAIPTNAPMPPPRPADQAQRSAIPTNAPMPPPRPADLTPPQEQQNQAEPQQTAAQNASQQVTGNYQNQDPVSRAGDLVDFLAVKYNLGGEYPGVYLV